MCLGANKVVKSFPGTRWSVHVNAISSFKNGYNNNSKVLTSITRDINQPGENVDYTSNRDRNYD